MQRNETYDDYAKRTGLDEVEGESNVSPVESMHKIDEEEYDVTGRGINHSLDYRDESRVRVLSRHIAIRVSFVQAVTQTPYQRINRLFTHPFALGFGPDGFDDFFTGAYPR